MGSKKPSKRTAPPPDSNGEQWRDVLIATLRETIGVLRAQLEAQSKLLASKDLQIQMVLEDRFFRPVVERAADPAVANTRIDAATLTDTTQFPTKGDEETLAKEDAELEKARVDFERELEILEVEQVESHVEEGEDIVAETLGNA